MQKCFQQDARCIAQAGSSINMSEGEPPVKVSHCLRVSQ